MAGAARLFPASPKPAGGPVTPAVRSPRVRFAKAARDQRFLKVIGQLQQSARKVGQHPPAKRKADEAQAAAKAPANEKEAGARANQVDDMKDAKAEKPNKGGFLAILRAEIDKVMPKNLDDADKFMKGGESQQIKGAVGGNVSEQKQKASGPTEEATKAPPDTGKVEGKEVAAMPSDPAAAPSPVAGAEAMPAPKPQAEVAKTAADGSASADQKLKDAELSETQLKKANDPRFSGVLTARDKSKETAAAGPGKYRASETKALNQARAGALGDASKGVAGLAATKNATGGKTKTRAQLAKEKDEADRKRVTDTIAAIFDRTRSKVDKKLSTLEADAMALFDAGADAALATMKSSANQEIDRFKDQRYGGLLGKGRWLADLFGDTPPEIKQIIARARQRFTAEMDALAVRVAAIVDDRLAEAKAIVAAGQAEVKTYVAGLAPNLKAEGQKAAQDIQSKFDELKQSIDDKAQDLAEKLAQKYKDASEKADAAAKEMEDANKGALRALAEKIGEIVKMLAEFADRVVALFKKAAGVLKKIVADPIGFLGNLLSAIKQGISQFVGNIWAHIKRGFMQWLFGELTKGGVQIPDGLPAPGAILKLVLNVMGLTWANIRPKIVKKIGEKAVSILEKVVEILQKLFTGGPAALWAEMQAFVGNLKAMVLDAILDWVVTKVITSAITKIASMFNPAGAIIQAIIMVYNVGSWLAANIGKILDFIESVVNSVDRIANGDVGGAASFIEQALARMIPILIGFLAGLLGLGGLGDKIKSFIKKVQATVGKAVDFVIDKVFNFAKKILGKITGKDKKDERTPAQKQADLDAGLSAAHSLLTKQDESAEKVQPKLQGIQKRYKMSALAVVKDSQSEGEAEYHIHGEVNPAGNKPKVKKTVDDEKNPVAIAEQAKPAPPPDGVDEKKFIESDRGNKRLFATLKGGKRFVFIVKQKRWNPLKDDTAIQQAEKDLRAELAKDITGYKEMVDDSKPANAPGFDAAGVVPGATPAQAQLVIGEVKGSAPTVNKQYMPKDKFTALTSNLGTNLRELIDSPEKSSVSGALQSGNVVIKIKLIGGMQVGKRASGRKLSTKGKIEAAIRKSFKAFLATQYAGLKLDQVVKAIRIDWDPP
ncbi:phage tail protein [Sorangium sp. So ce887]|uniref:phage tail protein n=1 Tax=Sorangium sp. So ce887 TaxID=3133324 RepID=UPI003F5F3CEA